MSARRLPPAGLVPLLAALLLPACRSAAPPPPPESPPADSTAELLDRVGRQIQPEAPFVGESRVVERLERFRYDGSPEGFDRRLRLALALLRVGRAAEAVELYDLLLEEAIRRGLPDEERIPRVELPRAVACLRLGEQENCVGRHTGDSCLFPLRDGAIHTERRGSTAAVEALEKILARRPEDLLSRWLLTIARQTLGDGPEAIRPEWRLDPSRWAPKRAFPRFPEVAGPLGLGVNGLAGGCVLDDFDGDGLLDVMASASYPIETDEGQLRLFRNLGDGSFEDVTEASGLAGIRGGLDLAPADFDGNGYLDVLVLRGAWQMEHGRWPNTLLRNDGGRFTDVTVRSGILRFETTQAAAWGDYDLDGDLDLFVGTELGFPGVATGTIARLVVGMMGTWRRLTGPAEPPAHLWRNRGDGTFEDVFPSLGLDVEGWIKGAVFGDYDRDGRPDLFLSRYGATNVLLHNDGPGRVGRWSFTDVTAHAGVGAPELSFPAWFFDFDDDGWEDLFVGGYPRIDAAFPPRGLPVELKTSAADEISEFLGKSVASEDGKPRLYRNRGDGTFEDVTRAAGLWVAMSAMGANFGDLDNDGFLDLYVGTGTPPFEFQVPNRAFRNVGGKRFEDVTVAANVGSLAKGHGVGFGDLDDDGDQDLYVVLGGAFPGDAFPNALFENPGFGNDWISLRLEGVSANRSAVGARIEVTLADRSGAPVRRLHRTVGSGGSFGASSLRQEIGLGRLVESGGSILDVEVTWPDAAGTRQRLGPLAPDAAWSVRQGEPAARLARRSFSLRTP
ncbi:MAG: VCBS repeat-containing protein [Acidobacteria bacterium]|nr:MAG: VCBS repeat-containing protein [Acidobacteriota bacterium]